jgi:hypothetical protein
LIIKKSKNFLDITGYQKMSNNKFGELCDQAYLFKTAIHTHIQAVRCLISSANKTAALEKQGTQITQLKCWTNLWRATGQEDINLEIRKRKFRWIDHTLRNEDGEVPKAALLWNPQGSRKT